MEQEADTPKPKPRKYHRAKKTPTLEEALIALQSATLALITAYKLVKPFIKRIRKKKTTKC